MWHGAHPGQPPTPEGSWLLRYSRRRDPEMIPRGDMRTGPTPVTASEAADLWDLCGDGMLAASMRSLPEQASEDELTAWLDATQAGDLRMDVEPMDRALDAWTLLGRAWLRLPERERTILDWRMDGLTCEQCGERLGLTRGRIHQLEARAICRLRAALLGEIEPRHERDNRICEHRRTVWDSWPVAAKVSPWRCLLRPPKNGREHWRPNNCGPCDNRARWTDCYRIVKERRR